jgi:hypothetical protein
MVTNDGEADYLLYSQHSQDYRLLLVPSLLSSSRVNTVNVKDITLEISATFAENSVTIWNILDRWASGC